VWAFGSRVKHTAQKFSDLDLALEAGTKLDYSIITQLNRSFEASRLPYKVDVVDLNSVEPYFRQIINQQKIVFHLSGSL
jgi:predicted nucleotidyltransferase